MLRISSAAGTAREVHLRPEARSWFVDVAQAGATYTADLGYYQSGTWKTVATSLPAVTPSDSPSEDKSVRFAEVGSEGELRAIAQTVASGKSGGQETEFTAAQNMPPPRVEWLPALDKPITKPDEVPSQIGMQLGAATRQSGGLLSPADWTPTQEQELAEILGPVRLPRTSSLELTEWVRREIQREIAAIQFAQPLSAPVSSWSAAEPPQLQGFWFNVNAELIIYGATERTATVTIAGQPVELRPDGTFSCRFALPDGEYELELAARSARDEALHAKLKFRRRTEGPSAGKPAG